MTVTIRPEHEKLIVRAIETGAYENADEVVGRALEMLNAEDEWLDEHVDLIGEKVERAFEQFDRGEFFSAEASLTDMEKRKAAWLAERKP